MPGAVLYFWPQERVVLAWSKAVAAEAAEAEAEKTEAREAEIAEMVLVGQSSAVGWRVYCGVISIHLLQGHGRLRGVAYIAIGGYGAADCGRQELDVLAATIAVVHVWTPAPVALQYRGTSW